MGCVSEKQKEKKAQFQYEIYERVLPNAIQEEKRYDVNKNPIVQRRAKSNSQTPDQQSRTKQCSYFLPSSKPQF